MDEGCDVLRISARFPTAPGVGSADHPCVLHFNQRVLFSVCRGRSGARGRPKSAGGEPDPSAFHRRGKWIRCSRPRIGRFAQLPPVAQAERHKDCLLANPSQLKQGSLILRMIFLARIEDLCPNRTGSSQEKLLAMSFDACLPACQRGRVTKLTQWLHYLLKRSKRCRITILYTQLFENARDVNPHGVLGAT